MDLAGLAPASLDVDARMLLYTLQAQAHPKQSITEKAPELGTLSATPSEMTRSVSHPSVIKIITISFYVKWIDEA